MFKSIVFLIASLLMVEITSAQRAEPRFVKDEVLVKFAAGSAGSALRALETDRFRHQAALGSTGWHRVSLTAGQSVDDAIRTISKLPYVGAVQPNFYYTLQALPNDPQWGATGTYGLPAISAPSAWDLTTGSSDVIVANIDTGMRLTHEDLAANIWTNPGEITGNGIDDDGNGFIDDVNGWDFRFNDSDPSDQHGHGTHTGGTIGAVGNNMLGVTGVNWNVRVMVIKIYSQAANDTTSAMLIAAYDYVRMMKERGINIRVTNNSYGGCAEACSYDQATKDAIDALGSSGVLNVFSAGNAGQNTEVTPFYPGSYNSPSILNVAASNSLDNRASFSNYGAVSVDVAAPGAGILSTTNGSNSSYGGMSGTSMAAPHVSGVAALLAAHNPSLSAQSLKATIMNTVDPLSQWTGIVKTGGRLNAFAALQNQTICNIVPSVSEITVPTKGGYVEIAVSAAANCDYLISSPVNWISVSGASSKSGSSTVGLFVRVNPVISRQASVTIGDSTINIRQSRGKN